MSGIQGLVNAPTTCPGRGPREQHQSEIDRLQAQKMAILRGTGGLGLDRLAEIDRQIELLQGKRDLHEPAPPQACPLAPHLATALSPLGNAPVRDTARIFPSWLH